MTENGERGERVKVEGDEGLRRERRESTPCTIYEYQLKATQ